ncbi:hypothetical protein B0H11DRAFT_1908136 [Mycena galericulata]|nr:hypothetical protein B0H11DRAFT_1908136 [Mycena galericulata]
MSGEGLTKGILWWFVIKSFFLFLDAFSSYVTRFQSGQKENPKNASDVATGSSADTREKGKNSEPKILSTPRTDLTVNDLRCFFYSTIIRDDSRTRMPAVRLNSRWGNAQVNGGEQLMGRNVTPISDLAPSPEPSPSAPPSLTTDLPLTQFPPRLTPAPSPPRRRVPVPASNRRSQGYIPRPPNAFKKALSPQRWRENT